MYYYASETTRDYLKSDSKWLYLVGSCGGYTNFGDVLQLKNAIAFHKRTTGLEPVVVMFLNSFPGGYYPQRLREWYGIDHFIFVHSQAVDASDAELVMLEQCNSGRMLQVYGGGFLNSFWGVDMITLIQSLISDLGVSKYIFSGQQVGREVVPALESLFQMKSPEVFGVRDTLSLDLLTKAFPSTPIVFSFDDATEIFDAWSNQSIGARGKLVNAIQHQSVLWHSNISQYVTTDSSGVRDRMVTLQEKYPNLRLLVAHAYNDSRPSVVDSLDVITAMGNDFPYHTYTVLNIARMSLDCKPHLDSYPDLRGYLSTVKLAVTSSYHTALLMSFFGVRVYLMAANDFYIQKQKGLGYGDDYDKFLEDSSYNLRDFAEERRQRKVWLDRLPNYFSDPIEQTAKTVRLEYVDQSLQPYEYHLS